MRRVRQKELKRHMVQNGIDPDKTRLRTFERAARQSLPERTRTPRARLPPRFAVRALATILLPFVLALPLRETVGQVTTRETPKETKAPEQKTPEAGLPERAPVREGFGTEIRGITEISYLAAPVGQGRPESHEFVIVQLNALPASGQINERRGRNAPQNGTGGRGPNETGRDPCLFVEPRKRKGEDSPGY